jgi:hypothetical protein
VVTRARAQTPIPSGIPAEIDGAKQKVDQAFTNHLPAKPKHCLSK